MAGYKALFVDYSKGSGLTHYEFDNTLYGPFLGVTVAFSRERAVRRFRAGGSCPKSQPQLPQREAK